MTRRFIPLPLKLSKDATKGPVARQDPRYRSSEEGRNEKKNCMLFLETQSSKAGHVTRMPDDSVAKKIFYGELENGKRFQGGLN